VGSPTLPARYREACPVGRGGMADIYRATDAELGRPVAVKVLAEHCAEEDEVRRRFLLEARAAARLSGDPHTVTIYDVGETQGRPYLVMEYLPGGSLASRLAAGRVDQALALEWLDQAARALDAAHERGIVHRDVKPGNLLLDGDDNVSVADFGIARAAGADSNTQTGVILGTIGYLAPEQAAGGRATAASDRYALAVVAHELLTGTRPEPTASAKLPSAARRTFSRALAEDPGDRFASCVEFVAALRVALAQAPAPATAPTVTVPRSRRRRRAPLAIATALAFGVLAFVLTAALTSGNTAKPPRTVVQTVTVPARQSTPSRAVATQSPAQPVAATPAPASPRTHHGKAKGHGKHGKHGED
jgi:eukaryotic-like serine/threonine-protein kinase